MTQTSRSSMRKYAPPLVVLSQQTELSICKLPEVSVKSLRATVFAYLIFSLTPGSFAQNIIGSTSIDIDQNSGMGTATCETDLDYDA